MQRLSSERTRVEGVVSQGVNGHQERSTVAIVAVAEVDWISAVGESWGVDKQAIELSEDSAVLDAVDGSGLCCSIGEVVLHEVLLVVVWQAGVVFRSYQAEHDVVVVELNWSGKYQVVGGSWNRIWDGNRWNRWDWWCAIADWWSSSLTIKARFYLANCWATISTVWICIIATFVSSHDSITASGNANATDSVQAVSLADCTGVSSNTLRASSWAGNTSSSLQVKASSAVRSSGLTDSLRIGILAWRAGTLS